MISFACAGAWSPYWWSKPLKQVPATFNARSDTVATKPMFRDAFKRRRCVIPMSGFYEWRQMADGEQPFFIFGDEAPVLSVAGLSDDWKNRETGETIRSCTMIVTEANPFMSEFHDRMPVFVRQETLQPWLEGKAGTETLLPASAAHLKAWPVSRRVDQLEGRQRRSHPDRTSGAWHSLMLVTRCGGAWVSSGACCLAARLPELTGCFLPCERLCFRASIQFASLKPSSGPETPAICIKTVSRYLRHGPRAVSGLQDPRRLGMYFLGLRVGRESGQEPNAMACSLLHLKVLEEKPPAS